MTNFLYHFILLYHILLRKSKVKSYKTEKDLPGIRIRIRVRHRPVLSFFLSAALI